jgi:hypothetical protein
VRRNEDGLVKNFSIMEGHGNIAFNLVVKPSVELGYVFLSLRL